jgi:hypothetical protein
MAAEVTESRWIQRGKCRGNRRVDPGLVQKKAKKRWSWHANLLVRCHVGLLSLYREVILYQIVVAM